MENREYVFAENEGKLRKNAAFSASLPMTVIWTVPASPIMPCLLYSIADRRVAALP